MPIIIVINCLICLLLMSSSIFWVPLFNLIILALRVCLFDYDNSLSIDYIAYFPLVSIFIDFIIRGPICFVLSIINLLYHVCLGLIYSIISLLRYLFRSLYDCLTYSIIWKFGKVPNNENMFIRKTLGPGVNKKNMY